MSKRHDADVKTMSPTQLRHEVMKLRRKIRWHRDLQENQRCWHCDLELYAMLPEERPPGQMAGPASWLLRNCIGYICRQQCVCFDCDGRRATRQRLGRLITFLLQEMSTWLNQHQQRPTNAKSAADRSRRM